MSTITFSRLLLAELPFMVNLPSGEYVVRLESESMTLNLVQESCAIPGPNRSFHIVPVSKAPPHTRGTLTELRTLVEQREAVTCSPEELTEPDLTAIVQHLSSELVTAGTALQGEELTSFARTQFEESPADAQAELKAWLARKLHARSIFPISQHTRFVSAVNHLVRHYMIEFGDPFAEEVVLHHLASTWTRGVMEVHQCDDVLLESFHVAGKIPPIIRRPWVLHPPARVEKFKSRLGSEADVDPVELLGARARSLLERGATRSAIVEASAGLEAAVARRLRSGLLSAGESEVDVDTTLKATQRFSDRCKSLMRKATGKSVPEVDLPLWERVVKHRDNYRHKITHDDSEPAEDVARQAVEDLVALAKLVKTL